MIKNLADHSATGAPSEGTPSRLPAHELVYRQLRETILFGELAPGQPVTIQGLAVMLNAGMTPVREAIRRLIAEGALVSNGNRRVSVPNLSVGNIDEIIYARQSIETELVLRAARLVSASDVEKLARIDMRLDRAILNGNLRAYLEENYRFHKTLYAVADAPILSSLADGLWLRYGPSLRVVCGRLGTQNLPDRHKEALEALKARDALAAAEAMRGDVIQGMEQVRQAIAESVQAPNDSIDTR